MLMTETIRNKIDYIQQAPESVIPPRSVAAAALEMGQLAIRFARIERVPRYPDGRRETDVEHSFMLAMTATELAHQLYPVQLDRGKISQYALVHDLIELNTGDVATFQLDVSDLRQKEATEHAALESLLDELPPMSRVLLYDYETQADAESRFVRAVDKLLPLVVDILGQGRRVMTEDFNITTNEEFDDCQTRLKQRMHERFSEFPQLVTHHALLAELFALEFKTVVQDQ